MGRILPPRAIGSLASDGWMIRFRPNRSRSALGVLLYAILVSLMVCIPACTLVERLERDSAKEKTVGNGATGRASPVFWLEVFAASGTNNLNVGHRLRFLRASLPHNCKVSDSSVLAVDRIKI